MLKSRVILKSRVPRALEHRSCTQERAFPRVISSSRGRTQNGLVSRFMLSFTSLPPDFILEFIRLEVTIKSLSACFTSTARQVTKKSSLASCPGLGPRRYNEPRGHRGRKCAEPRHSVIPLRRDFGCSRASRSWMFVERSAAARWQLHAHSPKTLRVGPITRRHRDCRIVSRRKTVTRWRINLTVASLNCPLFVL